MRKVFSSRLLFSTNMCSTKMVSKKDKTIFPLTRSPIEILLLLRSNLSIAALYHLSRTYSLLRAVFWEDKALQATCCALAVSRPLQQVPLESISTAGCGYLHPDYRTLCAKLVQHGEGCKVRACKAVINRSNGKYCSKYITLGK